jgi:hypothetical protein
MWEFVVERCPSGPHNSRDCLLREGREQNGRQTPTVAPSSFLTRLYWELTHICFEILTFFFLLFFFDRNHLIGKSSFFYLGKVLTFS